MDKQKRREIRYAHLVRFITRVIDVLDVSVPVALSVALAFFFVRLPYGLWVFGFAFSIAAAGVVYVYRCFCDSAKLIVGGRPLNTPEDWFHDVFRAHFRSIRDYRIPLFSVVPTERVNAWAGDFFGRRSEILLTEGIIRLLSGRPDLLRAVIAHELAHIKHRDGSLKYCKTATLVTFGIFVVCASTCAGVIAASQVPLLFPAHLLFMVIVAKTAVILWGFMAGVTAFAMLLWYAAHVWPYAAEIRADAKAAEAESAEAVYRTLALLYEKSGRRKNSLGSVRMKLLRSVANCR